MDILVCMKSDISYERIKTSLIDFNISTNIQDNESFAQEVISDIYEFAIVDERLWWFDDAVELLKNRDLIYFSFKGDFEEILQQIREYVEEDQEKEKLEMQTEIKEQEEFKENKIYEPQIRIIEKEIIVEKEVPKYIHLYSSVGNKLVGVVSLSHGAGSTFVTVNLARAISQYDIQVSCMELPFTPYVFDYINLSHYLEEEGKTFTSFPHVIDKNKKIEVDSETIFNNISWLIADPREELITEWNYIKMQKLIYSNRKSVINFLDLGKDYLKADLVDILNDLDMLLVVVDPLPVSIMNNEKELEHFKELKKKGLDVRFIINKFNAGVNKKMLLDYLDIEPFFYVHAVDSKYIYKSIYDSKIPYDLEAVKQDLSRDFSSFIQEMIPSKLTNQEEKKSNNKVKNNLLGLIRRVRN